MIRQCRIGLDRIQDTIGQCIVYDKIGYSTLSYPIHYYIISYILSYHILHYPIHAILFYPRPILFYTICILSYPIMEIGSDRIEQNLMRQDVTEFNKIGWDEIGQNMIRLSTTQRAYQDSRVSLKNRRFVNLFFMRRNQTGNHWLY